MECVQVAVVANDPIIAVGVTNYLQGYSDIAVQEVNGGGADVLVSAIDRVTSARLWHLREDSFGGDKPIVLVVNDIDQNDLLVAVDMGVAAVLRRRSVTAERLHHAVMVSASGGAVVPNDLLGGLLRHLERLQRQVSGPHGPNGLGFTAREIEVLRMLAEGTETPEIAEKLSCSERTVKGVVSAVTKRLNLRNRTQAVAHACRSGVI
ncbi:LuxR C-terminal-related transcriptional regulator [Lentzea sp. NPDC051213]|uniref:helix-turn-helix transcriptional regulator n=1 Tax=Lentzea sp. NPDC051213 TaxID=3364126 RepID=UPI0037B5A1FC